MKAITLAVLSVLAFAANADVAGDLKQWFIANTEKNQVVETIVIAPGYKMVIAGKALPVVGTQECPRADGMRIWFFGGDTQGGSGCMVIRKETSTVQAQFVLDGKNVTETWAVERRAPDKTLLRRPNGDYLTQAN